MDMLLIQWGIILILSLYVLVKGADLFVGGAERVGVALGWKQFVVGVLIVGVGTSLPELASSLAGVFSGVPELVIANVVGSNIANILLVLGVIAFLSGPILIKERLIKTELPIFIIATVHFTAVVIDGVIDRAEGLLLVGTLGAYFWYLLYDSQVVQQEDATPTPKRVAWQDILTVLVGLAAVLAGAKFAVDMTINIATLLGVSLTFLTITVIAIGTSLPELAVSIQAVRKHQTEMAVGNIFGSSAFNLLAVAGIPALIMSLPAGVEVMTLGLGVMVAASIILFVSGLARQVMRWEGLMLLLFFAFFIGKLISLL